MEERRRERKKNIKLKGGKDKSQEIIKKKAERVQREE